MAFLMPLKEKYRASKPRGFKSRSSNQNKKAKEGTEGTGIRRRSYGPWWYHKWASKLPLNPHAVRDIIIQGEGS